MPTVNEARRAVEETLAYLQDAELALYTNPVTNTASRVSWHSYGALDSFLDHKTHSAVGQYRRWLTSGNYSAVLRDGSLLQITYDLEAVRVVAHRLAYIPCPVILDQDLLDEGHPIDDIVALYTQAAEVAPRSHLRFDFDARNAKAGHPAAHLTINSADCRIACAAPIHVRRFVDFVYRHFYPAFWRAHAPFFDAGADFHIGEPTITDTDRSSIHIAWVTH